MTDEFEVQDLQNSFDDLREEFDDYRESQEKIAKATAEKFERARVAFDKILSQYSRIDALIADLQKVRKSELKKVQSLVEEKAAEVVQTADDLMGFHNNYEKITKRVQILDRLVTDSITELRALKSRCGVD